MSSDIQSGPKSFQQVLYLHNCLLVGIRHHVIFITLVQIIPNSRYALWYKLRVKVSNIISFITLDTVHAAHFNAVTNDLGAYCMLFGNSIHLVQFELRIMTIHFITLEVYTVHFHSAHATVYMHEHTYTLHMHANTHTHTHTHTLHTVVYTYPHALHTDTP